MADLSLDDYIGKKNFKVQFQNNFAQQNTQNRPRPFLNKAGLSTKKTLAARNGVQNRMHANFGGVHKKNIVAINQTRPTQNPVRTKAKPVTVTGLGNANVFDARQKLSGAKVAAGNANGTTDARQKIITSQKQKGTFDARSRIKTKQNPASNPAVSATGPQVTVTGLGAIKRTIGPQQGIQIGGKGGLTKTLKNNLANGGSQVEMFGNSLQITRSVPNSEITFDGKNKLTVTKRASAIQDSQPLKRPPSPIRWSAGSDATTPSPPKRANLIKTYKTADSIQFAAERAAAERLRIIPAKITASPKNPIPVITSARRDTTTEVPILKRRTVPTSISPTGVAVPTQPVKTKSVYRPVTVKKSHPDLPDVPYIKQEEEESVEHLLSPLQGYKVVVTNLDPVVSQDDLIELFGAIGALKRAKISHPGVGEVVYVKKEDAQKAAAKYHNRELDGLPMQVKVVTPLSARIQQVADEEDAPTVAIPEALRLPKTSTQSASVVEVPLIHKALFKIGTQVSSKPVTFTVKI